LIVKYNILIDQIETLEWENISGIESNDGCLDW